MAVLEPGLQRERVVPGERALAAEGVTTGARSFSASAYSSPPAPGADDAAAGDDRRAFAAAAMRGFADQFARGAGSAARPRPVTGGTMSRPSRTFCGISTHTGPCGEERTPRRPRSRRDARRAGSAGRLTTFAEEAFWSRSSCSWPRRRAEACGGIWLERPPTGTRGAAASCSPARVSAPGPVERNRAPASPVMRAYASAAKAALFSTRERRTAGPSGPSRRRGPGRAGRACRRRCPRRALPASRRRGPRRCVAGHASLLAGRSEFACPGASARHQRDQFVGGVGGGDAGDLRVVVRGGDLDDVGADQVQRRSPRMISSSSRLVMPPASGVPVPGAWAGSSTSMSTEMYSGRLPIRWRSFGDLVATPR